MRNKNVIVLQIADKEDMKTRGCCWKNMTFSWVSCSKMQLFEKLRGLDKGEFIAAFRGFQLHL